MERRKGTELALLFFGTYLRLDMLSIERVNFMSEGSRKEEGEDVCANTS